MKGIYRDGYYDGSIELRNVFNRRCVKCGRGDLVQSRTMRIRTGIVFWNLIFSLMLTCVKGTKHCSNSVDFLMRLVFALHCMLILKVSICI
uniref:Transmembrane protein n=1 Tax=Sphaeramia orbicularis TaxID=375764 RepID=A0A673CP47_9TELE